MFTITSISKKIIIQSATHIYKSIQRQSKITSNKNFSIMDIETERIVWMDLEMTGLNIETDHIMEVACIITDSKLNIIAEIPEIVIHQPTERLENMNSWCVKQHGKTGLTEACKTSQVTLEEAENIILNFFKQHIQPRMSSLAGNSVWCDRIFLKKYMPKVENYLHYRIIDVSTIKELCRRWNQNVYSSAPKKQLLHRSLSDIKESISELQWYRENFLKTME